jgi:transposase-like protein
MMSITLRSKTMRRPRRNHSPEFKAKVALDAITGDLTMAELVKKYDVHANQITDWEKQLLSGASDVFGKGAQKAEDNEKTVQELHAKIGQLAMENDFLERGLNKIHGPRGKNW